MQGAAQQVAEAGDLAADPAQVVVDVAEVLAELVGDDLEVAADDLVDGRRERHRGAVEVEDLALELVDPPRRVVAFVGEDLALDLLDVDVDALGGDFVAVDDVIEDRVEGHPGPVPEQVRAPLDPLAHRGQLALAVAHA